MKNFTSTEYLLASCFLVSFLIVLTLIIMMFRQSIMGKTPFDNYTLNNISTWLMLLALLLAICSCISFLINN